MSLSHQFHIFILSVFTATANHTAFFRISLDGDGEVVDMNGEFCVIDSVFCHSDGTRALGHVVIPAEEVKAFLRGSRQSYLCAFFIDAASGDCTHGLVAENGDGEFLLVVRIHLEACA